MSLQQHFSIRIRYGCYWCQQDQVTDKYKTLAALEHDLLKQGWSERLDEHRNSYLACPECSKMSPAAREIRLISNLNEKRQYRQ